MANKKNGAQILCFLLIFVALLLFLLQFLEGFLYFSIVFQKYLLNTLLFNLTDKKVSKQLWKNKTIYFGILLYKSWDIHRDKKFSSIAALIRFLNLINETLESLSMKPATNQGSSLKENVALPSY